MLATCLQILELRTYIAHLDANGILRIVPLGGLGRIGGNMMAYETANDLILVDCGMLFPTQDQPGIDYCIPDITYVTSRLPKLRGIVLTHAHEDHHGALPYWLPELNVPVYGTKFTLALAGAKLTEFEIPINNFVLIRDNEPFSVGEFNIEPIPVTHSIPDCVMLAIHTPVGTLVHTGDFKLDDAPIDGRKTNLDALKRLGDQGVLALLSDSTNAEKPGHTHSEGDVAKALHDVIGRAPFRVALTTFASNIHRIQSVIDASVAAGRKVVLAGRSMQQNVQLSMERGFLKVPQRTLVDISQYESLPRSGVTVLASGSQGEREATMTRIAKGAHSDIKLEPGDWAIMSSRKIPGNERAIGMVMNHFAKNGVEVVDDRTARVHASGHACNDEQRKVLELVRPHYFVPLHGEYRHMKRHAALAEETGVAKNRIFVLEDGQPLELVALSDGVGAQRALPVPAGLVFVDGNGVGDVDNDVLKDRRSLADAGVVTCTAVYVENGGLVAGPDVVTRGLITDALTQDLVELAEDEVHAALTKLGSASRAKILEEIRLTLRRFFKRELNRRPVILPVVMQL